MSGQGAFARPVPGLIPATITGGMIANLTHARATDPLRFRRGHFPGSNAWHWFSRQ
jgi:hypothetical protein